MEVVLYISETSRYANIVFIGMYLVYLVPAYKKCQFQLFAPFPAISELLAISYLGAFIIACYGNFNSSYSLFFSFFHVASKLCKSHL